MMSNYERTKAQRIKNIAQKKFYCEPCSRAFKDSFDLKNHMGGMKHNPEKYVKYECSHCNYTTRFKPVYTKHLTSKRHIRLSPPS